MSDALIERAGSTVVASVQAYERAHGGDPEITIDGAEFRGLRAVDLARMSLEASGQRVNADPGTIAELAVSRACLAVQNRLAGGEIGEAARVMQARRWAFGGGTELIGAQGVDMFPNALENAMHRVMHATFSGDRAQRYVWRRMCEIGTANDYRPHNHYFLGGLPDFAEAGENGQYPMVRLGDVEKGTIEVRPRGSEVRVTREVLVNDDLGRVMRTPGHLAIAALRTVENLWFANLAANAVTGDFGGAAMFTAGRGNLVVGAAPITADLIYTGMVALETQQAVGEHDYAELRADTLLVHPTQFGLARTIIESPLEKSAENRGQGGPNDYGVHGMIDTVVRSPRVPNPRGWVLLDSMATPWMASFLGGMDAPYLQQMEPWSARGLCYLGAIDVGVAGLTWRGAYLYQG